MNKPINTNKLINESSPYNRREEYTLGDLTLWRVGNNLVEVVVNEGVDANGEHIKKMFECCHSIEPLPRGLIINRENDYSINMSVFWQAKKHNPFKYVAMVNNGRKNQYFSESLWPKFIKRCIFNDRTKAIDWLNDKLKDS